eukprot:2491185-Rhodomonas_salina.6
MPRDARDATTIDGVEILAIVTSRAWTGVGSYEPTGQYVPATQKVPHGSAPDRGISVSQVGVSQMDVRESQTVALLSPAPPVHVQPAMQLPEGAVNPRLPQYWPAGQVLH